MSDKKNDDFMSQSPPEKTTFKQFLYNPRTNEVLGRTVKSWAQILVFYIVLYAFLAGFFALLMFVFFRTLEDGKPKWTQKESLIGSNPGMGYRPMHPNADVLILEFDKTDKKDLALWNKSVTEFLAPYQNATILATMAACNYTSRPEIKSGIPCKFPIPTLKNCSAENSFGFADGNPCVFLKMNKIFDWEPKPYTYNEINEGKTEEKKEINMPEDLKSKLLNLGLYKESINRTRLQIVENNVWVTCGASEKDQVNVTWTYDGYSNNAQMGEAGYDEKYPIMGFPTYYYPYNMQKNYLSPFVVVQFFNLPKGDTVKINCQLWGKGIQINRQRRLGMTNIEILSK